MATLLGTYYTYYQVSGTSTPNDHIKQSTTADDIRWYFKVYLDYQNQAQNKSYIYVNHYFDAYGIGTGMGDGTHVCGSSLNGGSYQSVTKDGTTLSDLYIGKVEYAVSHNSDGTGSFTIKCRGEVNESWWGYGYQYTSTKTLSLPSIPRASSISDSVSTVEIGQDYTMTIGSKAVSSYTLKLYYQLNNGSEVLIDDDVSAGTYTYTIPLALVESLPSATSGTFKAILKTYNGSTLIGSNSVSISITVPSSYVPTCSLAISETNAIMNGWGVWVKGKSKISGVITAEGVSGSTISSYSTTANNSLYTTAEFTTEELATIGEQSIIATAKDTRNRTATDTETITVLDYSAPTYVSAKVERCLVDGTLDDEGTYGKVVCQYSISSCSNNNAKSLKVVQGLTEKTFTLSSYSGTFTADTDELFEDLSASSKYDFTFYLIDSFNTSGVEQPYTMPTSAVTTSYKAGGKGFAFGKVAIEEDTLDSAWVINSDVGYKINGTDIFDLIYPVGSIYISVSSTNPSTLFGGTWTAWGAGRVPVGIDASQTEFDTVEETGGAKTHTLTVDEIPSHYHYTGNPNANGSSGWYQSSGNRYSSTATTGTTGGGQAHNNLQPYITCYMWKRTA